RFLVLELVEGETLAERIQRGAIPLDNALKVALQIAEALEAAHEKGIIHRDLKPANVKITPEGVVKVLDFGLAKALEDEVVPEDISQSPTISQLATKAGIILGTAAYMSPEQAKGKPVDKRTDIWAFGAVLYEMLTGQQAFSGEDASEILAVVIAKEPDLGQLSSKTPVRMRELIERCLRKDRKMRVPDIADARISIQEYQADPSAYEVDVAATSQLADKRHVVPSWMLGVMTIALLISLVVLWPATSPAGPPSLGRFAVTAPGRFRDGHTPNVALSPDGARVVFAAVRGGIPQLYERPMDRLEATPMPGTEDGHNPFFSPNGQWVGFFADRKLKKVSLLGGRPQVLCEAPSSHGGTWGPDDTIYFSPSHNSALSKVSAAGGTPEALTSLDASRGESAHSWPQVLPGGRQILFTISKGSVLDASIAVESLETGERRILLEGFYARYVPTGHLVYAQGESVLAVQFDVEHLEVTGAPVPVLDGVRFARQGAAEFAVSEAGLLAYRPAGTDAGSGELVWVDREGSAQLISEISRSYWASPRLSPDGKRVAIRIGRESSDIWVYELARDTLTRLTFEGSNEFPIWTPDGQRVAFTSRRDGGQGNLFWKRADGTGQAERLTTSSNLQIATAFSPQGEVLIFAEYDSRSLFDIWMLPLDGEPRSFLHTPFQELKAVVSPDGRWMAYHSNESGQREVYVQAYPEPGSKWKISTDGGTNPVWAPDGRELFYRNQKKMMALAIESVGEFRPAKPRLLFEGQYRASGYRDYDIAPDGQRFLMIKEGVQTGETRQEIIVVLNWFEELKRLVPTGK
ncbi:protein kinase, partial [Acidobacteria bacterium AH-259-G07]|nr:protein kinase [Acidobacteria bacterium AH-259-G07]